MALPGLHGSDSVWGSVTLGQTWLFTAESQFRGRTFCTLLGWFTSRVLASGVWPRLRKIDRLEMGVLSFVTRINVVIGNAANREGD